MSKKEIIDLLETFEKKLEIAKHSCEKIEEIRQQLSKLLSALPTNMITPSLFDHIEELDNKIVARMWDVKRHKKI